MNSGFVRAYPYFGNKKTKTLYQLSDYYTMFFYKFLKNREGKDEAFWTNGIGSSSRNAWAGFTFEQLCKDHIEKIKSKLGITGVLTQESSWFLLGSDEQSGAQIDLLVERDDRIINLCEMKFSTREFEIDKEYHQSLLNKMDAFRLQSGTKKNLQLTFVTTFGVKKNMYSSIVQRQILLDDLF